MPRKRAPGRLDEIADAALRVFSTAGYRRARMQDVATEAGVSPGLLYTYAAGKEALFALVVQREAGVDVRSLPLPAPNLETAELTALVRKLMRDLVKAPALEIAEKATHPSDNALTELHAIVAEHYDGVNRARGLLRIVERCALDWPELAQAFYGGTRKRYAQRLSSYLAMRAASGELAQVPDFGVAARFIIESVAWFANHRYGDPDGAAIDDDVARHTAVLLVTNAFAPT
jgi:AcrR family transcriptional regulator